MWSGSSTPAYGADEVSKIAVIMTDGDDKIDCNATNGNATSQAEQLCTAMKARGITIYTIGFDIEHDETAIEVMTDCASAPARGIGLRTPDGLPRDRTESHAVPDFEVRVEQLKTAGVSPGGVIGIEA